MAMASYASDLQIKQRDLVNGLFHRQALVMGLGNSSALGALTSALRKQDRSFPSYQALIRLVGSKKVAPLRAQILAHWSEGDPAGPVVIPKQSTAEVRKRRQKRQQERQRETEGVE